MSLVRTIDADTDDEDANDEEFAMGASVIIADAGAASDRCATAGADSKSTAREAPRDRNGSAAAVEGRPPDWARRAL